MRYGYGLGEAVKSSIAVSSTTQEVGKQYQYILQGFVPGSQVFWTSFKDGQPTGELNASYGHVIESNGSLIVSWTPAADNVGVWSKIAGILAPDGSVSQAKVDFRVIPAQTAIVATNQPPYEENFWQTPLFSIGNYEVTPTMLGIGLGAFWLFSKRR